MRALTVLAALALTLLGPSDFAEAAPALRASTPHVCSSVATTNPTCALSAAASAGDLIVACGFPRSGGTDNTVPSDATNGSYTYATVDANSGSNHARCSYFLNSAATTPTVTFHFSSAINGTEIVLAYSGIGLTSALVDAQVTNFGTTVTNANKTCGNLTATAANQLYVQAFLADGSPTGLAPGGTETERGEDATHQAQLEDKLTSGSGSVSGIVAVTGTSGTNLCVGLLFAEPIVAPTFSVAPAVGTRTTSSIPITATTACTDCTFYGVAYTDGGSTPTCTQIKAGQDGAGSAAYKSANVAMTSTVQGTITFGTYTDGTIRDSAYCLHSTAGGDSTVSTIADIYKIPVSACTYSSATSGGATYSCTLDGPGTVYGVACIKDSTDATITQVEAAHCTGDVAAKASANRSGTGSLTVGTVLPNPVYDFSFAGTYGSQHEAATHQDFDRCLAAASGKQVIGCPTGLTSIAVGSAIEALNALIAPDWAVGDIPVCDTYTHDVPGGTQQFPFLLSLAGFASYSGGDGSRTYANCDAYDVSVGAMATVANANNDLDWWDQDPPVSCTPPFTEVLKLNVAMNAAPNPGNIDFSVLCTHPLGDPVSDALTSGTLPHGLTLSMKVLSGTPDVENETGVDLIVTGTSDVTGASATQGLTIFPVASWTLSDCTSSPTTETACLDQISLLTQDNITPTTTYVCTGSVPVGDVVSQNPAASAEVAPYDTVALTVLRSCGSGNGGRLGLRGLRNRLRVRG